MNAIDFKNHDIGLFWDSIKRINAKIRRLFVYINTVT